MYKMNSDYDYLFKILIIGDSGVGKSSLLMRFVDDTFTETHITTIGVDFKIKTVDFNGKIIKMQIWDTAGQERFRTITSSYYRGAHGMLIVYDVSDSESFQNIHLWLQECERYANADIVKILVGNKTDSSRRTVSFEMGLKLADQYGMTFVETSAKNGMNVESAFMKASEQLYEKIKKRPVDTSQIGTNGSTYQVVRNTRNVTFGGCC